VAAWGVHENEEDGCVVLAVADIDEGAGVAVAFAAEAPASEPQIEPNMLQQGIPAVSLKGTVLRVETSWTYCWSCTGKRYYLAGLQRTNPAGSTGRPENPLLCGFG